jgi:hypothetical protein
VPYDAKQKHLLTRTQRGCLAHTRSTSEAKVMGDEEAQIVPAAKLSS